MASPMYFTFLFLALLNLSTADTTTNWSAIVDGLWMGFDFGDGPLQILSEPSAGKWDWGQIDFADSKNKNAGGVSIEFTTKPTYWIKGCSTAWKHFDETLIQQISGSGKGPTIWTISKPPADDGLKISVNGVNVLTITFLEDCQDKSWKSVWRKDIKKIKFKLTYNDAFHYYRQKPLIVCSLGYYQTGLEGSCYRCPQGTFSDIARAVGCKECPAGTLSPSASPALASCSPNGLRYTLPKRLTVGDMFSFWATVQVSTRFGVNAEDASGNIPFRFSYRPANDPLGGPIINMNSLVDEKWGERLTCPGPNIADGQKFSMSVFCEKHHFLIYFNGRPVEGAVYSYRYHPEQLVAFSLWSGDTGGGKIAWNEVSFSGGKVFPA